MSEGNPQTEFETDLPFEGEAPFGRERRNSLTKIDLAHLEEVLRQRGTLRHLRKSMNLVALPLLILSAIGVGFILVWAENILVPFVIAIFFSYLIRPIADFLNNPFKARAKNSCMPSSYTGYGTLPQKEKRSDLSLSSGEGGNYIPMQTHSESIAVENTGLLQSDGGRITDDLCDDDRNNGKSKGSSFFRKNILIPLARVGCPRVISVILALIFFLFLIFGLIFFFVDAVEQFEQNNWRAYEKRALDLVKKLFGFLEDTLHIDIQDIFNKVINELKLFEITSTLVVLLMDAMGYAFIVFLFVMYMLFEDTGSTASAPTSELRQTKAMLLRRQIDSQIQRYLLIKTLISAIVGFCVFVILGPMLNVKLAHVFGVVTFLANYIPNVGAVLATLIPIPILVLDEDQTPFTMLLAVLLPMSIHAIVGNIVEPKVFGDTMELHAVVVLLSLSFWFTVWGIPGAILAVPIMAVIRIIVSNIQHPYTHVILELLEGRLPGSQ